MEKNGLISGENKIQDNKKVIYYEITDSGMYLLYYIRDSYHIFKNTAQGTLFVDFLNDEI